jgi:hypothetical protein
MNTSKKSFFAITPQHIFGISSAGEFYQAVAYVWVPISAVLGRSLGMNTGMVVGNGLATGKSDGCWNFEYWV